MAVRLRTWDDISPPLEVALQEATRESRNDFYHRFAVSHMAPFVGEDGFWMATMKGNFKHRLVLCGAERPQDTGLTEIQQDLRHFAANQYGDDGNPGWRKKDNAFYAGPERPPWSNGCQCYMNHEHYCVLREMVRAHSIELWSKNVVVSNEMMPTVVAAFATVLQRYEFEGRDAYLYGRVACSELKWFPAPGYNPVTIDLNELPVHG